MIVTDFAQFVCVVFLILGVMLLSYGICMHVEDFRLGCSHSYAMCVTAEGVIAVFLAAVIYGGILG